MANHLHILLLAGSGEARQLAKTLAGHTDVQVTSVLPYAPRDGAELAGETHVRALSSADQLASYVDACGANVLLDATHPFSESISHFAVAAAELSNIPVAQVMRPPWRVDTAQSVADIGAACDLLRAGQRVFTNVGRDLLGVLTQKSGVTVFARSLSDPVTEMDNVTMIRGTPPFTVEDERTLFALLNVDVLVTKNTGSQAAYSKIEAAVALGIQIVLIDQPAPVADVVLPSVEDVLNWIADL